MTLPKIADVHWRSLQMKSLDAYAGGAVLYPWPEDLSGFMFST